MWLAYHQRVMTKDMRKRRGFTTIDTCHRCRNEKEDINHILQTCPDANHFWSVITPEFAKREQWKTPFKDWMSDNINSRRMTRDNLEWRTVFAVGSWWLWKWRNEEIFSDMHRTLNHKIDWIRPDKRY